MSEPSFGTWLRRERERRGATLKTISDQIKVSVPLLQGLETDDLSRWPTGIFRRAFVRAYSSAIGLEPEEVIKRFELEHAEPNSNTAEGSPAEPAAAEVSLAADIPVQKPRRIAGAGASQRARVLGTAADLTVALMLGLGLAAADSRLLWPVLLIAAYYGLGVLLTGTSPMVALLNDQPLATAGPQTPSLAQPRTSAERRASTRRGNSRPNRAARQVRQRVQ